jgi:hypothetical protein
VLGVRGATFLGGTLLKDVDESIPNIQIALAVNHAEVLERILRDRKLHNRDVIPMSWQDEAMIAEENRVIGLILDQISQGLNAL